MSSHSHPRLTSSRRRASAFTWSRQCSMEKATKFWISQRLTSERSFKALLGLIAAECLHRVYACSLPGGKKAGNGGADEEQERHRSKDPWSRDAARRPMLNHFHQ